MDELEQQRLLEVLSRLIEIRSISGHEEAVIDFFRDYLTGLGWGVESIPVFSSSSAAGRENLFVTFGTPRVLFTTHLDVVPAADAMFVPRIEGTRLYGRGACDAKGIAVSMVFAALELRERGFTDFGLLFVVGEEVDGCGALRAGQVLRGRGIEYLVNGEPTEGKLAVAHKGWLSGRATFHGKSCHSGYPEFGIDANRLLLDCAQRLYTADFGSDPVLGNSSINIGVFAGGTAANVVSPEATMHFVIRTVGTDNQRERELAQTLCAGGEMQIIADTLPVRCMSLPGFETTVVSYSTDIGNFRGLAPNVLLYGPGTITVAHTDAEFVEIPDLVQAVEDYVKIATSL